MSMGIPSKRLKQASAAIETSLRLEHYKGGTIGTTLVNVYVALPVFTSVAGRSYAHFMEQNGGAHDINR